MTVKKKKKLVRLRGSKTHGYGSMKKHRGSGNRGGKGRAGSGKRADSKKPSIWKNKYFGKRGFKSKRVKSISAVNIEYLDQHIEELKSKKLITKNNGVYSVNLKELGFNKILGNGKTDNKYRITVDYASKKAVNKIQGKGGQVILVAKNQSKE